MVGGVPGMGSKEGARCPGEQRPGVGRKDFWTKIQTMPLTFRWDEILTLSIEGEADWRGRVEG